MGGKRVRSPRRGDQRVEDLEISWFKGKFIGESQKYFR